jgi:hypothetical protein
MRECERKKRERERTGERDIAIEINFQSQSICVYQIAKFELPARSLKNNYFNRKIEKNYFYIQ